MVDRPSTLGEMLWHRVKSLDVPSIPLPEVQPLNVQSPWPAPPQNSLGNHLMNALPDVRGMARGIASGLAAPFSMPYTEADMGREDQLTNTLMQMPDEDLTVIQQSPERSEFVRNTANQILQGRAAQRQAGSGLASLGSLIPSIGMPSFNMPSIFGEPQTPAPLGASEFSTVPSGTMEPPPEAMHLSPVSPAMAQEVAPEVVQAMEQLPQEQKQQMLDGMVKMLDKIVVEGEAPQGQPRPMPSGAGPAKPENAPDERTLALAQVYEVAASTGLVTPDAMPFGKFVEAFDQWQGGSPQDDQMARLLEKGEEKKAEFTEEEAPRKGPKISDMEDQMNRLGGYRNSNLGRTGA